MNLKKFSLCAALLLGGAITTPASAATVSEWRAAVDGVISDILAIHPEPFAKVGETTWRREAVALQMDLPQLSESERVVRLMKLVAILGDGHTSIQLADPKYASWYPVRIYEFSDGYFITSAHKSVSDLSGAQVLDIAGKPVAEAMKAARELSGADNEFDAMERLYPVHNAYLMKAMGFADADGSLATRLRLANGRIVTRKLTPQSADEQLYPYYQEIFDWHYLTEVFGLPFGERGDWITAYKGLPSSAFREVDETRPPFLQYRRGFTSRALPERDAYYLQYNQTSFDGMVTATRQAFGEIDAQKPKRLIVDTRYNFGGDGSTVEPMIREFIQRQDNPPWEELYLITGRKTFSAGLFVIDAFRDHTDATIIGEPAGASFVSYGDAVSKLYPEIGVTLYVSTLRHQLEESNDLRPFIPVDAPAPQAFSDYKNGRDPAIDPILEGEDMRSLSQIATTNGGAAARRAHEDREAKYVGLSWYRPPTEIELRRAVDALVDAERLDDAADTAALNTQINPFVWNAWYGLGNVLKQKNRTGEAMASYKCVLLLDPNNWNKSEIETLFTEQNADPAPAPGCPVGSE